jgi:hypothetical protein
VRILVCGGRDFQDYELVCQVLDGLDPELVIQGGANGADTLSRCWAMERGIPCMEFQAPWLSKGKGAGPVRNAWMIKYGEPDLVVAFPGGSGTADMVTRSLRAGLRVLRYPSA